MDFWGNDYLSFFRQSLSQSLGWDVDVLEFQTLAGGNNNRAAQVFTSEGVFYIKWHKANRSDIFATEARSLRLLQRTGAFMMPKVVGHGQHNDRSYLILDYIDVGKPMRDYWDIMGQQLAYLHAHTSPLFGLSFDNYIGWQAQCNTPTTDGPTFFFEHRLLPQAGQAFYEGLLDKATYESVLRLQHRLPDLLPRERPALLHGELWPGNVMTNEQGLPMLIDPAPYYGYREADLAHTRLFGGFDHRFYDAYQEAFPLEPGFEERLPIYNLYALLVNVNQFGSGYVSGVERILKPY